MSRSVGCREWAGEAECSIPSLGAAVAHAVKLASARPLPGTWIERRLKAGVGTVEVVPLGAAQSRGKMLSAEQPWEDTNPRWDPGILCPTPCMSNH